MLSYDVSLKKAIDAINKGLETLQNLEWASNSVSRMPEEIVKEYTASDPTYLVNEIFDISESGKYQIQFSGKGISAYTIKSSTTNKVVYTERELDDSYTTSELIIGKGDQIYINASPDSGAFIVVRIIRKCTLLDLIQEMLATYAITRRAINARIDNLIATAGEEGLPTELLDLRVNYDGEIFTTAQQRFFALEKRVKIMEEAQQQQ